MKADEPLPDVRRGLAEVGEPEALVGRTPKRAGGDVKVAALEQLELTCPQHEVEGEQRGAGEVVVINAREDVEVSGMEPELTNGVRRAGTVTTGNGGADGQVELGNKAQFADERKGGHGAPYTAGSHRIGKVRKGKLNLVGNAGSGVQAVAGKSTQGA